MSSNNTNFYSAIHSQLVANADKTLLITNQGQSFSYADIQLEVARLASFITSLGLTPGDRVSVQVEKSPAALCLYLACLRGGFVFHPLNTAYQSSELEYFLGNAEPALLICDESKTDALMPLAEQAGVANVLTLNADGSGSLIEQSRGSSIDFPIVDRATDDMAALLYSSGTTGVPKGIMLSHGNLLSNAQSLVEAWGFTSEDRLLHALPVFHVHGLFVAFGCTLLSGGSMRWLPGFNPKDAVRYLPECTVMMGVPTYYTRLLDAEKFTADTCKNIRLFVSGSAPLLEETFVEFEQRTGHRILERYGMTETNMNTSNPLEGVRKPGTVGLPLPGVEVRIADEDNQSLAQGEIGNLQVKGPNVFTGYWKMPDKTKEDFTADGFFNTGDKGQFDAEGYVSIVGRAKDLVITGGLNVYPKEIELLIDDLPGVKESAIIGVPHTDFGEAVVAVVVPSPGEAVEEANIIAAVKNQLANFKVPKRVIFVEELPRNTMGKVQKKALRDIYGSILS